MTFEPERAASASFFNEAGDFYEKTYLSLPDAYLIQQVSPKKYVNGEVYLATRLFANLDNIEKDDNSDIRRTLFVEYIGFVCESIFCKNLKKTIDL